MRSSRSRSPGTAKSSRRVPNSKATSSKHSKAESISKFFTKDTAQAEKESAGTSAYSNKLTKIQKITPNDDDDFKTPKPVKKLAKIFTNPDKAQAQTKRKYVKKERASKRNTLQKTIEDTFKKTDVNGEHLQMAVALSMSAQEAQKVVVCDGDDEDDKYEPIFPSTQEVRENARKTLEQYGFKYSKSGKSDVNATKNVEITKRKKKSRYHYIKPILFLRTDEDREEIINSKVAKILTECLVVERQQTDEDVTVYSKMLRSYRASVNKIIPKNNLPVSELQSNEFYVDKLNLSPSDYKCGNLLKRWEDIPGRELSPVRSIDSLNTKKESSIESADVEIKEYPFQKEDLKNVDVLEVTSKRIPDNLNDQPSKSDNNTITEHHNQTLLPDVKKIDKDYNTSITLSTNENDSQKEIEFYINANIEEHAVISVNEIEPNNLKNSEFNLRTHSQSTVRSVSPDLFDSDDEIPVHSVSKDINSVAERICLSTQKPNTSLKTDENVKQKCDSYEGNKRKKSSLINPTSKRRSIDVSNSNLNIVEICDAKIEEKCNISQLRNTGGILQESSLQENIINPDSNSKDNSFSNIPTLLQDQGFSVPSKKREELKPFDKKCRKLDNIISASLLSNINTSLSDSENKDFDNEEIKSDNGICHYESFCENEEMLDMDNIIDLGSSSDEESHQYGGLNKTIVNDEGNSQSKKKLDELRKSELENESSSVIDIESSDEENKNCNNSPLNKQRKKLGNSNRSIDGKDVEGEKCYDNQGDEEFKKNDHNFPNKKAESDTSDHIKCHAQNEENITVKGVSSDKQLGKCSFNIDKPSNISHSIHIDTINKDMSTKTQDETSHYDTSRRKNIIIDVETPSRYSDMKRKKPISLIKKLQVNLHQDDKKEYEDDFFERIQKNQHSEESINNASEEINCSEIINNIQQNSDSSFEDGLTVFTRTSRINHNNSKKISLESNELIRTGKNILEEEIMPKKADTQLKNSKSDQQNLYGDEELKDVFKIQNTSDTILNSDNMKNATSQDDTNLKFKKSHVYSDLQFNNFNTDIQSSDNMNATENMIDSKNNSAPNSKIISPFLTNISYNSDKTPLNITAHINDILNNHDASFMKDAFDNTFLNDQNLGNTRKSITNQINDKPKNRGPQVEETIIKNVEDIPTHSDFVIELSNNKKSKDLLLKASGQNLNNLNVPNCKEDNVIDLSQDSDDSEEESFLKRSRVNQYDSDTPHNLSQKIENFKSNYKTKKMECVSSSESDAEDLILSKGLSRKSHKRYSHSPKTSKKLLKCVKENTKIRKTKSSSTLEEKKVNYKDKTKSSNSLDKNDISIKANITNNGTIKNLKMLTSKIISNVDRTLEHVESDKCVIEFNEGKSIYHNKNEGCSSKNSITQKNIKENSTLQTCDEIEPFLFLNSFKNRKNISVSDEEQALENIEKSLNCPSKIYSDQSLEVSINNCEEIITHSKKVSKRKVLTSSIDPSITVDDSGEKSSKAIKSRSIKRSKTFELDVGINNSLKDNQKVNSRLTTRSSSFKDNQKTRSTSFKQISEIKTTKGNLSENSFLKRTLRKKSRKIERVSSSDSEPNGDIRHSKEQIQKNNNSIDENNLKEKSNNPVLNEKIVLLQDINVMDNHTKNIQTKCKNDQPNDLNFEQAAVENELKISKYSESNKVQTKNKSPTKIPTFRGNDHNIVLNEFIPTIREDGNKVLDQLSIKRKSSFQKNDSISSMDSTTSQDSILISDEELNYSSINSPARFKTKKWDSVKSKYIKSKDGVSHKSHHEQKNANIKSTTIEFEDLIFKRILTPTINSAEKLPISKPSISSSQESICISDEELNVNNQNNIDQPLSSDNNEASSLEDKEQPGPSSYKQKSCKRPLKKKKSRFEISDSESGGEECKMETTINEHIEGSKVKFTDLLKQFEFEIALKENYTHEKKGLCVESQSDDDDVQILEPDNDKCAETNFCDSNKSSNEKGLEIESSIIEANKIDYDANNIEMLQTDLDCGIDVDHRDEILETNSVQQKMNPTSEKVFNIDMDNYSLVHPRLSELKKSAPIRSTTNKTNLFFEDTFANLLEQTNVISTIEQNIDDTGNNPEIICGLNNKNNPATTDNVKTISTNHNKIQLSTNKFTQEVNKVVTPEKYDCTSEVDEITTPNGRVIIKTRNVSPMPDYDAMDTPSIHKELAKFGMKKLRRTRGVELLKYIYEATHPFLNSIKEDGVYSSSRKVKRRRLVLDDNGKENVPEVVTESRLHAEQIECVGDVINIGESESDMIFEKKCSKRILSCQLPLHIAWHNFLCANPEVRENILLYEPLQVEVLYGMLKEQGLKYNIQDLISFLDKKCITIRMK